MKIPNSDRRSGNLKFRLPFGGFFSGHSGFPPFRLTLENSVHVWGQTKTCLLIVKRFLLQFTNREILFVHDMLKTRTFGFWVRFPEHWPEEIKHSLSLIPCYRVSNWFVRRAGLNLKNILFFSFHTENLEAEGLRNLANNVVKSKKVKAFGTFSFTV